MARVKVSLDVAGLRADATSISLPQVRRTTRKTLTRSAILCPVRHGRLRASGRMKVLVGPRGPQGVVEYPVRYAAAVHDGSDAHVIRARKKKALAFKYQGTQVIVRSVRHPGTKPRPFLRIAAMEVAAQEGMEFKRRNG